MKVQTKITLLLVAVIATFLAGLWGFNRYGNLQFRRIADERWTERNKSLDDFLTYFGDPLLTLATDYTNWSDMADAIGSNDRQWFEDNVNDATLDSFRANSIWIFAPNGTAIWEKNNLVAAPLGFPVPPEAFARVFAQGPFCHFFIKIGDDIIEVRGGTVHRSEDFARQRPSGYFFAGKLWSKPMLREMSMFTGNEVTLVSPPTRAGENVNDEENGLVAFSRPLYTWDGKPLAQLVVRNESPVVRQLKRSSRWLLYSLLLFAVVLLLLLTSSLVRWVSRPLRQIMQSLKQNDPRPVEQLSHNSSEFGELARTIHKFFEQRDNLIREMEERRATEEALRKSEEELRHSQKMEAVGRLAGGVAHDFNNLLTAIIGYAELISAREDEDSTTKQHAELIRKAGEQAATLTRQLLAFSRKQMLQPKVIDLNQLVVDMERLLRRVIGERFDLRTVPEAELGTVLADPTQIEQVILNLGVNARDAMPRGGKLAIRTANVHLDKWRAPQISVSLAEGDYVELSVSDTGEGMDEVTKSRIFEPFFTTKGPGKGTGLGLATVYGIVRQTGGGISVESELGKGSTFRIYLPLERAPVDRAKPAQAPLEKSANFETVLVAEDEEIVRELVCDVLAEQGYNVMCAVDGIEALQKAKEYDGQIHLLITDVIMPHMNGQELAEQLSAERPDMKVLFVSGYSDNDIGDHGVIDRRIDLLQKPFTPQALARRIRDVIQEGRYADVART
ncbi:MAG TPA: ATP-binding protein [Chthoniobacterales bacterium]|nr:ATP-binding protein [Chthoniobacterales bacterium]